MKIRYKFINGEKTEVEVDEAIGLTILESRKEELNQNRRERHHCYSLDAIDFEGESYTDGTSPESELLSRIHNAELEEAINSLTETQKKRLELYLSGYSMRQIAEIQGIAFRSVADSFDLIRKKFKKFL